MFFRGKAVNQRSVSRGTWRRKLQFDLLEQRRLLAGIDVYIFNDANESRAVDASDEIGLAGRVVFLDLNRNEAQDAGEPLAISNRQGVARFDDLAPGSYEVRLLGSNLAQKQTTPLAPARNQWETLVGATGSQKVLAAFESALWSQSETGLVRYDLHSVGASKQVTLGGRILETALTDSTASKVNGYSVVQFGASRNLVRFSVTADTSDFSTVESNTSIRGLTRLGSSIIAIDSTTGELIRLSHQSNPQGSLDRFQLAERGNAIDLRSNGFDRFAVKESIAGGERLSLYRLATTTEGRDFQVQLVAERSFQAKISSWSFPSDSQFLFVDLGDGIQVHDCVPGLPLLAVLPTSEGPQTREGTVLYDPLRNIVYAEADSNQLTAWDATTWTSLSSTTYISRLSLSDARLSQDGSKLFVGSDEGIVSMAMTRPIAATAVVRAQDVSLVIGIRSLQQNQSPSIQSTQELAIDEDAVFTFDATELATLGMDSDGDTLHWIVLQSPSKGNLTWSTRAGGTFTPFANAEGQDSILIGAFDGQTWSAPLRIPITIRSLNDTPTDLSFTVSSLDENPDLNSDLTQVVVNDPDANDLYEFFVDDNRFAFDGNALRLVRGTLDYEANAFVPILVSAVNRFVPSDRISRTLTLTLRDQNDPPSGIRLPDNLVVPELQPGAVIAEISVDDQDNYGEYDWNVSDDRFEIRHGRLRLAAGHQLDYELETTVAFTVTAVDRQSGHAVNKLVQVQVLDQDDSPSVFIVADEYEVAENSPGVTIGYVFVMDADASEQYSIGVSDSRFEVVRGAFKLRRGHSVQWEDPGYLNLTLTATSLTSGTSLSRDTRLLIVPDSTPYHNDENPGDVDGDGAVTPLDPLIIVNHINRHGPGAVSPEGEGPMPNLDVDGDGAVTPLDILILVNEINRRNSGIPVDESSDGDLIHSLPEGEGESDAPSKSSLADLQILSFTRELDNDELRRRSRKR